MGSVIPPIFFPLSAVGETVNQPLARLAKSRRADMATKKAPTTVSKSTAEKPSNLFRRLSAVLLVNTAEFTKATPATQTKTIAAAEGLPVEFVTDFLDLGNKRLIRDKLLSGRNVGRELEFNDVTLSDDELKALELIKPILAKIEGIGPSYPWLPVKDFKGTIECTKDRVKRNGHTVGKAVAKRIWDKASKFWSGGPMPSSNEVATDGHGWGNRTASYSKDAVTIGCQTIPRVEVEYIARCYNFEPIVFE
jgi:hypothetical protein